MSAEKTKHNTHGGEGGGAKRDAYLFQGWQVVQVAARRFGVVVTRDGETQLDQAVNSAGKDGWLIEREPRSEKGSVVEQKAQVTERLVRRVGLNLGQQRLDDGVLGVDLQRLFRGCHVLIFQKKTQ